MNSRNAGKSVGTGRFFFLSALLFYLLIPSFSERNARAESASQGVTVTYPDHVGAGEAIKIRVRFSTPPPAHHFYKMEVIVDGQPVALVDISEESATWITAPGQQEGRHQIAVIWRNPPGGTPEKVLKDLSVLPKAASGTGHGSP